MAVKDLPQREGQEAGRGCRREEQKPGGSLSQGGNTTPQLLGAHNSICPLTLKLALG